MWTSRTRHFVRHFGKPAGFSSPGFYSDERVMRLLDRLGFLYNGDGIGGEPRPATADGRELSHWTIPVTLAGPRTIPFLEYHGARGTPEVEVMRQLHEHLESRSHVVLYGHPCYEGVRDGVLRQVFAAVLEHGYRFVTMQTLAERLRSRRRRPMIRVLSVFGTRPEAIKMAPVVHALQNAARSLRERGVRVGPAPRHARPGARRLRTSAPTTTSTS